ncbi:DNA polymerase III subunit delta [Ruminococcus flavefaciens]|uniref:DNA polymerase III subunit delta n=1 Tax=Ruminococcus flavefaciens TaxID=1265 RepID=UPI0026F35004|nr:DNA polymerase III subunit delta [Ruminococcus flavefaciens]MDD7515815.1 DNA polymerase III subunit delta [Ruminococcus flavefaciens]MDY5693098.1 DNA polymerase III subunit delta [Ruminococcus flavefaciens]
MPQTDPKTIKAQLRKGELKNLYYIYGKNVPEVEKLTKQIITAAVGDNEEFALNKLEGRYLDTSELYDMMQMMPMMSDHNCILINDYNCEKPRENMAGLKAEDLNKKLVDVLKDIPQYTVVIINVTGFEISVKTDFKTGKNIIKDKNKKLYDLAAKIGEAVECPIKTVAELAKDIAASVSARGSLISLDNARELAEMCQSDTLTIKNEIDKLCAYAGSGEITSDIIHNLVHRHSDVTFFKLADAVAVFNKRAAFDALDELMQDKDNRGAVLANITASFIDMYRASCARKCGKQIPDVKADFAYVWEFKVKNAFRDSSRMSIRRLRECVKILRDTNITLNSGGGDEKTILEQTVTKMLMTKN